MQNWTERQLLDLFIEGYKLGAAPFPKKGYKETFDNHLKSIKMKKSAVKKSKIQTGSIPANVGFSGKGGGVKFDTVTKKYVHMT